MNVLLQIVSEWAPKVLPIIFGFIFVYLDIRLALTVLKRLKRIDRKIRGIFSGTARNDAFDVAIRATGSFGCFLTLVILPFAGVYFMRVMMLMK